MNALARLLRREIKQSGPISFARFMDLALYSPGLGYYERPRLPGRSGDFFTSVSVGPLFGQLLAFQFALWFDARLPDGPVQIVETGAHDGRLAADILTWIGRRRPDLLARLRYWLVDPSPARRVWQEKTLRPWGRRIGWARQISDMGGGQVSGVIFSNEFLDSLPVHRLAWDASGRVWREWQVAVQGESFVWRLGATASVAGLPPVPGELAAVLPDGFVIEASPLAAAWWSEAAAVLRRGKLLAIDYGPGGEAWFRPEKPQGTLRAFARHQVCADLLARPGGQDLTADVNFSSLEEAGRKAGLRTEGRWRQAQFLTHILAQTRVRPETFEPWSSKSAREFQTLTHPEHLGERFQVLLQSR
jgi:SAM-dependent MidA family methyltransferase